MATFMIAYVERDKVHLYRQFWESDDEPSAQVLAANEHGELGRQQVVNARSMDGAIAMVEKNNPDCVVIRDYCSRVPGT